MAPTLLFKNGILRFSSGTAIFVPDGSVPADCLCCDANQCPVCVDYTSGECDVTVSGFPTSVTWTRYTNFFVPYEETWEGLQKLNGVSTLTTDENCIWSGVSKTATIDITRTFYTGSACSFGSVSSTETDTVTAFLNVAFGSVTFSINPLGIGLRFLNLFIADPCSGGTDSEFFTANFCASITGFDAEAEWVTTLV